MATTTLTRKKLVWAILPLSLLLLLILIPIAGKFAAMHLLKQQGATSVQIEDIDLNLFTGVLGIDNFAMRYEDLSSIELKRLTINLSPLALFSRTIRVQNLDIDGLTLKALNEGDRLLLGLPISLLAASTDAEEDTVTEDSSGEPWAIELPDILFRQLQVNYAQQNLQTAVVLDQVKLTDFSTGQVEQALDFQLEGEVNGARLALSVTGTPLATPRQLRINIELDRFPLASLEGLIREQLPQLAGFLSLNTALEIQQAEDGITVKQYGAIALDDLSADLTAVSGQPLILETFDWSWTGQTQVQTDTDFSPRTISARGSMFSDNNQLKLAQPDLLVQLQGFSWNGEFKLAELDINEQLQLNGDLVVNRLQTQSTQAGLQPVDLSDLALNGIAIRGLNQIGIGQLELRQLALANPLPNALAGEQALLHQQRITLNNLQFEQQQRLTVESAELEGMKAALHIDQKGEIPLLAALATLSDTAASSEAVDNEQQAATEDKAPTESVAQSDSLPFHFQIKDFHVTGSNTLSFLDQSITPQYQQTLEISELQLNNIRNDKPEEFMELALQASLDKHSSIKLNGKLQLFSDKKNIDLLGDIHNVNLIKLSPYVAQQTGYNIHTGALDAKIDFKVKNDELDVRNELKLQNIKLTPDKQEKIEKLTKNLTMPLDQALNILRDKKGNVKLEVPIEGDINNPEFGFQDVINIAMTKALKTATVSYLKTFLQPYGTALMVAQMVGNYAMKIRLEPLAFTPATVELNETHKQYLDDLVTRMQEKDALRLRACGQATPVESSLEDPVEKENVLTSLGEQRANVVRQYMVDQGIAADRLFTCNPEIDASENAQPRVELAM